MAPTTCECRGGPLDGELAWWKGERITHQSVVGVWHLYVLCQRGHYHYDGAIAAPANPLLEDVEP